MQGDKSKSSNYCQLDSSKQVDDIDFKWDKKLQQSTNCTEVTVMLLISRWMWYSVVLVARQCFLCCWSQTIQLVLLRPRQKLRQLRNLNCCGLESESHCCMCYIWAIDDAMASKICMASFRYTYCDGLAVVSVAAVRPLTMWASLAIDCNAEKNHWQRVSLASVWMGRTCATALDCCRDSDHQGRNLPCCSYWIGWPKTRKSQL